MSYVIPPPYGHRRYRNVPRNVGVNLWIYDRKYLPRERSTLSAIWVRLRWQVRRWRWEYGF
jgi:hypothetical protein